MRLWQCCGCVEAINAATFARLISGEIEGLLFAVAALLQTAVHWACAFDPFGLSTLPMTPLPGCQSSCQFTLCRGCDPSRAGRLHESTGVQPGQ